MPTLFRAVPCALWKVRLPLKYPRISRSLYHTILQRKCFKFVSHISISQKVHKMILPDCSKIVLSDNHKTGIVVQSRDFVQGSVKRPAVSPGEIPYFYRKLLRRHAPSAGDTFSSQRPPELPKQGRFPVPTSSL